MVGGNDIPAQNILHCLGVEIMSSQPIDMQPERHDEIEHENRQLPAMTIPVENIGGHYSNFLTVSHTQSEFILDFCLFDTRGDSAHHVSRIIISATRIKNFLDAIERNIRKYEDRFGLHLPLDLNEYRSRGIRVKRDTD